MDTSEDWERLYRTLSGLGLPEPEVPYSLQTRPGKPAVEMPIAWPDIKVGIAFDHTPAEKFERKGWTVVKMSSVTAKSLPAALLFIDEIVFGYSMHAAENDAEQSVSKTEQRILEKMLRANLPMPDRNFRFKGQNGELLTIPDFAWHDVMLAVFVDGHHWHGGKSLIELMEQVRGDAKRQNMVEQRWKNKSAKDADVRRAMTAAGWTIIAVSDKTVDDGQGPVDKAVGEIVSAYRRLAGD